MEKKIETLNNLIVDDRLTSEERNAISTACNIMRLYLRKKEPYIDFQGWEQRKHTMKDLREFVDKNGNLADDIQILVLEDDGMGYGAINGYCTDIYLSDGDNGKKEVQIWF
jgi:hypothetical protein